MLVIAQIQKIKDDITRLLGKVRLVGSGSREITSTTVGVKEAMDVNVTGIPAALAHVIVDSSALPTGAATSALQTTGNTSLSNIDGKITACDTGAIAGAVTANAGTNLNTSALALEAGGNLATIAGKDFATQTTLSAINTKMVTGTDIGDVTINNGGAGAAVNIQDGGNTITVDGSVNVGTVTTLPAITGTVTANQGTAAVAANRWPVTVSDGTNYMPTGDAAARALFVKPTDGTNVPTFIKYGSGSLSAAYTTLLLGYRAQSGLAYYLPIAAGTDTAANKFAIGIPTFVGVGTDLNFDVSAGSGATILVSAGAGKRNRIHDMTISTDTTGLVTVSDGIGRFYMLANTTILVRWTGGKAQTTVATVITCTNAGGGNVACQGVYTTE